MPQSQGKGYEPRNFDNHGSQRGGSSEEPDEGNLQVLFCEGVHSNLGAITPERGALCALLDICSGLTFVKFVYSCHS